MWHRDMKCAYAAGKMEAVLPQTFNLWKTQIREAQESEVCLYSAIR